MHDTGTCPSTSGMPRTRDFHRPSSTPSAKSGSGNEFTPHAIGLPNMIPPGRSKLPARMFTTSTNQEASVPNSWLQVPMRPYSAALGAAAYSCVMRRMVSAGIRQAASTYSGVNSAAAARTASTLSSRSAMSPSSTRSSANNTLTMASRKAASVPGRIGIHSSARAAVPVRRGSMTTTLPPRARMPSSSPRMSAHASKLPCDAWGLPPMMIQ